MSAETVHLRELAEVIGPRPATTDAEAAAADYIERVFIDRGLEPERQSFVSPRSYGWAYVVYHLLTIVCAVASRVTFLRWPAFILALVTAAVMWMDLDTRWGLTRLMPKGPSQNVIAKHTPKARRGEKVRRVVVVAHYDSARSSLAFAPSMAKNFRMTFSLMKLITFGAPLLLLAAALPWTRSFQPWLWYGTLAFTAYLVIPLLINVHRELFMRPVDGANDNASGVAAMLGVMERIVPEPEEMDRFATQPIRRTTEEDAWAADVVPEGAVLTYTPAETPGASHERATVDFGDDITWTDSFDKADAAQDRLPLGGREDAAPAEQGTGGQAEEQNASVTEWLGVGEGFDARRTGRDIGTWDNFDVEDDDAEGMGFKGGSVAYEAIDDPEFSAQEASRIRRKVTEGIDRDLTEKEVWFVATGAEEVGTFGMQAFIAEYADELDDALIVNIDNVGTGNVHWVTSEGMAKRYSSDRRLTGAAKRVAREEELRVAGRDYRGLSTDATPALARGYRAMSVMAFDINGRLPNWHWKTDTVENVQPENLELTAEFVTKLIRAL